MVHHVTTWLRSFLDSCVSSGLSGLFLHATLCAYYQPYVSTWIQCPESAHTWNGSHEEETSKAPEMNESSIAKGRCSSLEFDIVIESQPTRNDLSVQPQGQNFQFRESPKRGFRISKCFWDCGRAQCGKKRHL